MKRLKKRAVILLAAAAMFTVSPAFAANQNGKGHSEDGRGVSGSTGNQGNGKGVGNAGGQKGNNNGGNGGSNGGNGNSNGGGKGNGNDSGGVDSGGDSNGSVGLGDRSDMGSSDTSGNGYFDGVGYEGGQIVRLPSTCEMYPTLWFCPNK